MNLFCQYCQKETAHDDVVKGMCLECDYDEEDIYDVKKYCLREKKLTYYTEPWGYYRNSKCRVLFWCTCVDCRCIKKNDSLIKQEDMEDINQPFIMLMKNYQILKIM